MAVATLMQMIQMPHTEIDYFFGMEIPDTQITLGTQDTRRRETKQ
jgi:hypothetical protein